VKLELPYLQQLREPFHHRVQTPIATQAAQLSAGVLLGKPLYQRVLKTASKATVENQSKPWYPSEPQK